MICGIWSIPCISEHASSCIKTPIAPLLSASDMKACPSKCSPLRGIYRLPATIFRESVEIPMQLLGGFCVLSPRIERSSS